jgi:hypothetical protein
MDELEPEGFELAMPFVNVVSNGGRYDDEAFVAGWASAALDERLASGARSASAVMVETVQAGIVSQSDLMAMRHGWTMERLSWGDDVDAETAGEWARLRFTRGDVS